MDNEVKNLIKFEIVTPERTVMKEMVQEAMVPTQMGEITILPKHIPLVAMLKAGVIEVKKDDGEIEIMSVSGGFVEVLKNKIVILADTAERAEEIDILKVEEARARAHESVKNIRHVDAAQFAGAGAALARELARLKAANRWRSLKK